MTGRLLLVLFALLTLAPAIAPADAAAYRITPTLIAESGTPAPGRPVTLAIAMHPAVGWHGNWENPGDGGSRTRIVWHGPAGVRFGALQYPVPQTLALGGRVRHVYPADYAELVTVDIPAGLRPGTALPISADLAWQACKGAACQAESAQLSAALIVGAGAADPARTADFDQWRAALPHPLGAPAHFRIDGGRFRLELPLRGAALIEDPHVFIAADGVIDAAARQVVTHDGDRLIIETAAAPHTAATAIEGVLKIGDGQGIAFAARSGVDSGAGSGLGAVPDRAAPSVGGPLADEHLALTLLAALGGAVLGGLLLNIMPCVFPVLSIKALSLARAGGSESEARREALSYTAGVVLVCAGLGAVLLALRSAGELTGWAFQLQDARVIIALLLLVSAIELNLAGLFELPMITGGSELAAKGGAAGSFWTGAFAAFIATPCSGPFMGTALGVALLLPPWASIVIFAGLGFGLALPFLALGFIPALRRKLPKPGQWTDRLRRLLSVPMFATALGLAWIAGRQAGVDAMAMAVGAAMVLGLALWQIGRAQLRLARYIWWPLLPTLAFAGVILATLPARVTSAAAAAAAPGDDHLRFDPARLATLRTQGRPILLYFTADWCVTCKVNEKVAIDRSEVRAAFAAKKIVVMVGDWTNGDPAISRFLGEHGRSGVPFYLFFPAAAAPLGSFRRS